MIKGAVFDCDGVLVDSEWINNKVFAELATEAGVPTTFEDSVTKFLGRSITECVASSSTPHEIATRLEPTGLTRYFGAHLYSATLVARGKPAPHLFLHAAQHIGVDPRDCMLLEDSPAGIHGGKAAGTTVIGFASLTPAKELHLAGADHVVENINDALSVYLRTGITGS